MVIVASFGGKVLSKKVYVNGVRISSFLLTLMRMGLPLDMSKNFESEGEKE